jgi:hypothetical protein
MTVQTTKPAALEAPDSAPANVTRLRPATRRSEGAARVFDSIVDLAPGIDNPTPMVRLSHRMNPHDGYDVFLKLEGMNPFGSIKDRTALYMLNGLKIQPDQVLVEPSAGNTGIALAAMANARGMPIEIAVPDGTPEAKKALLRFLGAELIEVEDELCPLFPSEGARGVVKSMVESEAFGNRYVSPNQYENELNVEAHYRTTGPEIWNQTQGRIDAFYAGGRPLPERAESGHSHYRRRAGAQAAQAVRAEAHHRLAGGAFPHDPRSEPARRRRVRHRRRGVPGRHRGRSPGRHHGRPDDGRGTACRTPWRNPEARQSCADFCRQRRQIRQRLR